MFAYIYHEILSVTYRIDYPNGLKDRMASTDQEINERGKEVLCCRVAKVETTSHQIPPSYMKCPHPAASTNTTLSSPAACTSLVILLSLCAFI